MDPLDCFPAKMRVDYPHKFFEKTIEKYEGKFNLVWSHLPEWTNSFKISRIYNKNQPIIGYCHWSEIPENGARTDNSFWTNLRGILQMQVCGVNSNYQKVLFLKTQPKIFNLISLRSWIRLFNLGIWDVIQQHHLVTTMIKQ